MSKIKYPLMICLLFVLSLACKDKIGVKKNISLKPLTAFTIETMEDDEILNSKLAFSDSILLLKSNSYNHTSQTISDSSVIFFLNGNKIATNEKFYNLKKKFNLKIYSIDSLLFPKTDVKRGDIIRKSKKGDIFKMYNEKNNIEKTFLQITKTNGVSKIFISETKKGTPTFFIQDITGDGKEELFFVQWDLGYWGNTYYFKIFEIE